MRKGTGPNVTDAQPGGWCFEYANEFYPDLDDTAMVLMALEEQFASLAGAIAGGLPRPAQAAARPAPMRSLERPLRH